MKKIGFLLITTGSLFLWSGAEEAYVPGHVLGKDYQAFSSNFLEFYCVDCHGDGSSKGDFSIDGLGLPDETNAEKWKSIWAQVAINEMPPKDEEQPETLERIKFTDGIISHLEELMQDKGGFHGHKMAKRGNFVNHDLLFGELPKSIKLEPTASPKRIWRLSPSEHITLLNELINTEPKYDPSRPGLRTHGDAVPVNHAGELNLYFGLDNVINWAGGHVAYFTAIKSAPSVLSSHHTHGFKNYPEQYTVNSAETMQILELAQTVLNYMAYGPLSISTTPDQVTDDPTDYQLKLDSSDQRGLPSSITYDTKFRRPETPLYHLLKDIDQGLKSEDLRKVIEDLYERLTFRPPTEELTETYFKLVEQSIEKLGKEQGILVGLSAMFLDRDALFRSELAEGQTPDSSGRVMLQDWELGLAVNHALRYIQPDTTLRKAIIEGKMRTKQDVKREITRMLNDDSIRKPRVLQFFREYFDYDLAGYICKDANAVTQAGVNHKGEEINKAMLGASASADRLVELILHEDKEVLKELLTTQKVVASPDDVVFYGKMNTSKRTQNIRKTTRRSRVKAAEANQSSDKFLNKRSQLRKQIKQAERGSQEWRELYKQLYANAFSRQESLAQKAAIKQLVTPRIKHAKLDGKPIFARVSRPSLAKMSMLPERVLSTAPEGERLGLLTSPAWLVSHSDAMDNHAIHRGIWVRERLLGGGIPGVPITVDAQLPYEPGTTLRSRMRITREKQCWSCHEKMDPLGLTFEMYNHMGVFRENEYGTPVDTSGAIVDSGDPALDGPVENAFEMISKLAESERVEQVFVRHAFRYWMGRNETLHDAPVLQAAHKAYRDNGGSMKALITSLVTSDAFLYRK